MRCADCRRELTDLRSVERRVGPGCWRKRKIAELMARQLKLPLEETVSNGVEQPPRAA